MGKKWRKCKLIGGVVMAVKKSELYSVLWEACNKLRGGVEPSRYKDYVLVLYSLNMYQIDIKDNLLENLK